MATRGSTSLKMVSWKNWHGGCLLSSHAPAWSGPLKSSSERSSGKSIQILSKWLILFGPVVELLGNHPG